MSDKIETSKVSDGVQLRRDMERNFIITLAILVLFLFLGHCTDRFSMTETQTSFTILFAVVILIFADIELFGIYIAKLLDK